LHIAGGTTSSHQGCYEAACANSTNLKVRIGSYWYNCPYGTSISADGFGGQLACPDQTGFCSGTADNNTWPEFLSITPTSGQPEDNVVITGNNFVPNMTIIIAEPTETCKYVNASIYECKIASRDKFQVSNLGSRKYSVIMVDPTTDRSCVAYNAFEVNIDINGFFEVIGNWLHDHPLPTAGICVGIVLLIAGSIYLCYRERKKARWGKKYEMN
jgi:hypothetical protein